VKRPYNLERKNALTLSDIVQLYRRKKERIFSPNTLSGATSTLAAPSTDGTRVGVAQFSPFSSGCRLSVALAGRGFLGVAAGG